MLLGGCSGRGCTKAKSSGSRLRGISCRRRGMYGLSARSSKGASGIVMRYGQYSGLQSKVISREEREKKTREEGDKRGTKILKELKEGRRWHLVAGRETQY